MVNILIIALILAGAAYGVREIVKHTKGQGACCGGGGSEVQSSTVKTLENPVLGKKIMHIEGMTCDHCKARVERALNRLDGVSAVVNLKKKTATVQYDREIDENELRLAVVSLDYKVTGIESAA